MAIECEDPDDVLRWYDPNESRTIYGSGVSPDDRIADIIVGKYPENAIAIWKKQAEIIIKMKNPDLYHFAVMSLIKVRDASIQTGKSAEFSAYILDLKSEHARKRRFIQELAALEGKKLIDDI